MRARASKEAYRVSWFLQGGSQGLSKGRQDRRWPSIASVGRGLVPDHFKPIPDVGPGAAEIIIDIGQEFRVFYVAKLKTGIYVLHAFEKKTQKTPRSDIKKGADRYAEAVAKDKALQAALKGGKGK